MKYNPDAYADYPILRPYSSDYPKGKISTQLTQEPSGESLSFKIDFQIHESTIQEHISRGDAICCALLYCSATCYTDLFRASESEINISSSVPMRNLKGRIEIHPSVIAIDDIDMKTDTAHTEYQSSVMMVNRRRQLAMDTPWYFAVGMVGPIESVFRLDKDDTESLEYGEFEFQSEPSERYIVVRSNPKTYDDFQTIRDRKQIALTRATVYLNALTAALGELEEQADDNEQPEGWAATVRSLMQEQEIHWPESCSNGLAAQRLLRKPLAQLPVLSDFIQKGER